MTKAVDIAIRESRRAVAAFPRRKLGSFAVDTPSLVAIHAEAVARENSWGAATIDGLRSYAYERITPVVGSKGFLARSYREKVIAELFFWWKMDGAGMKESAKHGMYSDYASREIIEIRQRKKFQDLVGGRRQGITSAHAD